MDQSNGKRVDDFSSADGRHDVVNTIIDAIYRASEVICTMVGSSHHHPFHTLIRIIATWLKMCPYYSRKFFVTNS